MKTCFKCGDEKPLTDFYKHGAMKDGHLGKCKDCTRSDSLNHRNNNLEKIREYDRGRGNRQAPEYLKEYRAKYPAKYKAHTVIRTALCAGKLFKQPCETCGTDISIHAHHDDYSKPLNIRWLCSSHHSQWHAEHGEALNPF